MGIKIHKAGSEIKIPIKYNNFKYKVLGNNGYETPMARQKLDWNSFIINIELDNGYSYKATPDHTAIIVMNGELKHVKVDLLMKGNKMQLKDGSIHKIISLKKEKFSGSVYDFTMPSETFYVNDILTRNCRLRLDLRQLVRSSSGGVGGAADKTGSIGVVTLNLPRMAYLNKGNKQGLLDMIGHYMDLASESLEVKRKYCDKFMELGMYPYSKEYLGTFNNHFSTIGIVGLTECCSNFMGKDLGTQEGQELGIEILNFMRNKLSDYQEKTGHLYNLEATPAESTAYRFAKHDVEDFEDIIVSGEKPKNVYYTNSCWLPVNSEINNNIWDAIDIQEKLQPLFTGGTVFHTFLGEEIKDWTRARDFVKLVAENTKLPYITLSPKFSICQKHGLITQNPTNICPRCLEEQQKEYERKLKEIDARIEELYKNQ